MKDESASWLNYALENLESARLLFNSGFLNPCLQNCQQSVEKAMKAIIVEKGLDFKKTHNILDLSATLRNRGVVLRITDEECMFLDSIYLPSKYPTFSVLPDSVPTKDNCRETIGISERVCHDSKELLG